MQNKDKIKFPGATVFVSYGEPTEMDKVGCQGMYIEKVEIDNLFLLLIYSLWSKVFN